MYTEALKKLGVLETCKPGALDGCNLGIMGACLVKAVKVSAWMARRGPGGPLGDCAGLPPSQWGLDRVSRVLAAVS